MKHFFNIFSFCLLLSALSLSCSKQEGCNDPNASNYVYEADKNDGSCLYDMSFIMATSKHFSMEIYIDGKYRDYLNYYESGLNPGCGKDTLYGYDPNYGQNIHGVVNVALEPGDHLVKVVAIDGTTWEKTYTLPENCLRIFLEAVP